MKIISIIFMIIGALIVVGTAGASDLDPYMPLSQIDIQLLIGISFFALGWLFFQNKR